MVIGLVLVADVSRSEHGVLVGLFALPAALVLYPFAGLVVVAILAAPFVYGLSLWLLWRWMRDGEFPGWAGRALRWLRARRPWGYRLRVEKVQPRQTPAAQQPEAQDIPGASQAAGSAEPTGG
jgi:hypothetical protein